mgnify:FL=1
MEESSTTIRDFWVDSWLAFVRLKSPILSEFPPLGYDGIKQELFIKNVNGVYLIMSYYTYTRNDVSLQYKLFVLISIQTIVRKEDHSLCWSGKSLSSLVKKYINFFPLQRQHNAIYQSASCYCQFFELMKRRIVQNIIYKLMNHIEPN